MSNVTEVVLVTSISDEKCARALNRMVETSNDGQRFTKISDFDGHTAKGFTDIILEGTIKI